MLKIRAATQSDVRWVLKTSLRVLHKTLNGGQFPDFYARHERVLFRIMKSPCTQIVVAETEGQDAGFCIASPELDVAHVIYVKKEHRGQGCAKALWSAVGSPAYASAYIKSSRVKIAPWLLAWAVEVRQ